MTDHRRVVLALALVFVAGFGLGRLTGGLGSSASVESVPVVFPVEQAPESNQAPSRTPSLAPIVVENEVSTPVGSDTLLESLSEDPRAAMARLVLDRGGDPQQAVDFVINRMSDDELISVIAGVTNFTEDDLSSLRAPRDFARRLSSITMDGLLRQQPIVETAAELVSFSTAVNGDNSIVAASLDIEAGSRRVYAVFPSGDYPLDEVVVKWFRTDNPELLLLGRYSISREDDQSYVWLERRNGWQPGAYGVEFYTSDDRLEKFASGQYVVQ